MPRTLFEHLSPDTGAKRILALDGGGVKSILTLGLLKPLEAELRRRAGGDSGFRLCDYYDLIGGASTGAVIATGLALGFSVDELIDIYMRLGPDAFGRSSGGLLQSRFDPRRLRRSLQPHFSTKTLGSDELRTGLALFLKRIDTGDAWVLTNHPLGPAYDPPSDSGVFPVKRHRLLDLVAASAAAPMHASEMEIDVEFDERHRGVKKGLFVDAAISGHNNPAVSMLRLALDPRNRFGWSPGPHNLMMTSCGAGWRQPQMDPVLYRELPPAMRSAHMLRALIHDASAHAIAWLQSVSVSRKPWTTAAPELGLTGSISAPLLDFQRIDVELSRKPKAKRRTDPAPPITPLERLIGRELNADEMERLDYPGNGAPSNLALLLEIGIAAGKTFVGQAYPDPMFDIHGSRV